MTDDDAEELWLPCEVCGTETRHALLRTQEGRRGGLTLQGVARCGECGLTGPLRLHEPAPVELELRLSHGDTTRCERLQAEADDRFMVGDRVAWAGGTLAITALERDGVHVRTATAAERPTVWARDAGQVRVRIAVHRGDVTESHHREFPGDHRFREGELLRVANRHLRISEVRLRGGKQVREAQASNVARLTCRLPPARPPPRRHETGKYPHAYRRQSDDSRRPYGHDARRAGRSQYRRRGERHH